MARDVLQWTAPSPLWPEAAAAGEAPARRQRLTTPAILRFATDTFMDDLIEALDTDPARLKEFVAKPETWRGPSADIEPKKAAPPFARKLARLGLVAAREKEAASKSLVPGAQAGALAPPNAGQQPAQKKRPLKLYQPAHQRYYVVASCLVCGRAGLPDHTVNPGRQERATFVVRRLFPPEVVDPKKPLPAFNAATWTEHAFVKAGKAAGWRSVAGEETALADGEDQTPLFNVNFKEDDGRRRRMLAGLVPVGRREAYMGAGAAAAAPVPGQPPPAAPKQVDPRMMLVWSQVTEAWKRLLERADAAAKALSPTPSPIAPAAEDGEAMPDSAKAALRQKSREQIQTSSWYVLLDFSKLLAEHLPNVWALMRGAPVPNPPARAAETTLATTLAGISVSATLVSKLQGNLNPTPKVAPTLKAALLALAGGTTLDARTAEKIEEGLDTAQKSYDRTAPAPEWPRFLFPLADLDAAGPLPPKDPKVADDSNALKRALQRVDYLAELIEQALPAVPTAETPAPALASQAPFDMREGWFRIRFVFERPECGPLDPPLVSAPTEAFQMAGFFDPDAPARPIRIALPIDTTPAGLRKFDKNTAFMVSDVLCGQIERLKSLSLGDLIRSVLPWPLHKDLSVPDGGPCADKDDASLQLGMICSLSIPIITICALLLLMIIVNLLDIIFRWVPYFLICFPIPGMKAKK